MKIRMFLVLAFLCMGFATRASAQMYTADSDCSWDFSPDDGTIYTTSIVEGQLNSNAIPGAMHTYHNYSNLNGSPMQQTGGPSRNYVSVTNYQQATINPGELINYSCGETVDCNMMGQVYNEQDNYQIPVVTLQINFQGQVNPSDPNILNYGGLFGTKNLGAIANNYGSARSCVIGYEAIGTVSPQNYSGEIQLQRDVVAQEIYKNQAYYGGAPGIDDSVGDYTTTSPPTLYDLDGTGWVEYLPDTPDTYRYRTFFIEQAYLPGTAEPVSAPQPFYTAVSCTTFGDNEYSLVADVPGDNTGAEGSIALTWNLQ